MNARYWQQFFQAAERRASGRRPAGERNGRDPQGRFAAGQAGVPDQPFARRVAELRWVMLDACSDEDMRAIVAKLMEMALNGDMAAAKLVLQYGLGRAEPEAKGRSRPHASEDR